MKFLCDQMFSRLGRWLRAAGYDTEIVSASTSDKEILEQAQQEERFLLSRDRYFLEQNPSSGWVVFLAGNRVEEAAQELGQRLRIDWLKDPFSRCLVCNQKLVPVERDVVVNLVPPEIFRRFDVFWKCLPCNKIYWQGSHAQRMLESLKRWQGGAR